MRNKILSKNAENQILNYCLVNYGWAGGVVGSPAGGVVPSVGAPVSGCCVPWLQAPNRVVNPRDRESAINFFILLISQFVLIRTK
jgi:hypothetical protein